jgi:hypothetical protein
MTGWRKPIASVALAAAFGLLGGASPALARPVGGTIDLLVTDCRTGAPIRAGVAVFGFPHMLAAIAAPITDGHVGPVGFGHLTVVVILSSPGYRESRSVVHSAGDYTAPVQTLRFCLHPVPGSPEHLVTTTYPIDLTAPFETSITTNWITQLQFTSSPGNCSAVQVALSVDGSTYVSDPLAPGESTPVVDFALVAPGGTGSRTVDVAATGGVGCNTAGTLTVATALPLGPLYRDVCERGGWRLFISPVFASQGECTRFASTAGIH